MALERRSPQQLCDSHLCAGHQGELLPLDCRNAPSFTKHSQTLIFSMGHCPQF